MIARYNKRLKELEGVPSEMCDYMARSAPFLEQYERSKNKQDLFRKFLEEVEGEGIGANVTDYLFVPCAACKSSNLYYDDSSSDTICTDCGSAQYTFSGERSYKEEQECDQTIVYSYKRENHFNEWLAQFQAKEVTNIPPEVLVKLREEFKKQKVTMRNDITQTRVRDMLKKLKLNKYYEHTPYITCVLNGITPPQMSQALEDKLRLMFRHIQEPFKKFCPEGRKNFLSYSYILYKFCELLSEDDFLVCFPLLKSKEKLYKQDQIWKKITEELKWEFIPTI
jgi:hypothetical protein